MARHHVFVVVADIKDGCEDKLRALDPGFQAPGLEAQPPDPLQPPRLDQLERLHYASFVIFDRSRLETPRSKLVFECNIDGQIAPFLDALLADPAIDGIYQWCEGYPLEGEKSAKLAYLMSPEHLRRPQVFHVGAPDRSVKSIKEDRELRRQLDADLDRFMAPSLTDYRGGTLPGMREYGTWDALSPWAAWIVGILGPALSLWLLLAASARLPKLTTVSVGIFCAITSAMAIVAALKMWIGVVPGVRDRARPWVKWTLAGVVVALIAVALREGYSRWVLGLAGLYIVGLGYKVYAAYRDRGNERLRMVRSNASGPSVVATWKMLRRDVPEGDRMDWLSRLVNWSVWPLAFLVLYVPIRWMAPYRLVLISCLTLVFALKGGWLAILLGWPANDGRILQDKTRILAFMIGLPVLAFGAFFVVIRLGLWRYPSALAALVLLLIFSLWAVPLPSPAVAPPTAEELEKRRRELAAILRDEDHEVTNHMSAVVVLNQDRWYRAPVLRSFLWLLNRFYYRAWLPDIYRGKLFGVPTVHFAQWVLLDQRNFLFLSNYDNSWTSYLDDFGVTLTTGIQKVWGQGLGNPGTKDLGRFKDYARTTMVRHSLWYSAYPGLTVRQVWNNEQIRRAITRARDEEAMMSALRRFGAAKKVLPDVLHARSR